MTSRETTDGTPDKTAGTISAVTPEDIHRITGGIAEVNVGKLLDGGLSRNYVDS